MKKQKFFNRCGKCFRANYQFKIYDIRFPAGTFILRDEKTQIIYLCTKFPNYNGNAKNIILHFYWIDMVNGDIGDTYSKGDEISITLFDSWDICGRPKVERLNDFYEFSDLTDLMRHDCAHKKGSGQRIYNNQINGPMKFNQVTECAYWANLDSRKSGNASVVAANIR